jgi:hypothetical protein
MASINNNIVNNISENELEKVIDDINDNNTEIKSNEVFKLVDNTDHWETEDIMKVVQTIHDSGKNRIEREFKNKGQYPKFEKRYPMLYRLACEDHLDISTLNYMMNMRNQVLNNERSVESASRIVGDKFYKQFVKPVVNTTAPNKKPTKK